MAKPPPRRTSTKEPDFDVNTFGPKGIPPRRQVVPTTDELNVLQRQVAALTYNEESPQPPNGGRTMGIAAAIAEAERRKTESPLVEAYNRLDEAVTDLEDFAIESGYPDPVRIGLGGDPDEEHGYAYLVFDRNDDKRRELLYVVEDQNDNELSSRPLREVSRNRKMLALGQGPTLVEHVTVRAAEKIKDIDVLVNELQESLARARGGK